MTLQVWGEMGNPASCSFIFGFYVYFLLTEVSHLFSQEGKRTVASVIRVSQNKDENILVII